MNNQEHTHRAIEGVIRDASMAPDGSMKSMISRSTA